MMFRGSPFSSRAVGACMGIASMLFAGSVQAGLVLSGGGLEIAQQGGTFDVGNLAGISTGAVPFTSSDLGDQLAIPFHKAVNINDEVYGNSNSWIGADANPYPRPFAGVAFSAPATLSGFAFGRDNLGGFSDRNQGLYELQYTTVPAPNAATADALWTTVGTLNYGLADGIGLFSNPAARHRFNVTPVAGVTGIRLIVPATGLGGGTAIDEIEAYSTQIVPPPPPATRVLTPAPGFAIGALPGEGPTVPSDPAPVPDNLALASNGATPIGSSALGIQLGIAPHQVHNINDGLYGNANSWIGADGDNGPFIGVAFNELVAIESIAWGRDNGNIVSDACGGTCTDRSLGVYGLQYTQLAGANGATPFTGDPLTGWASIGSIEYLGSDANFTSYLRHEYSLASGGQPIVASAFRLIPPASGLALGTAIDELEVYGTVVPEPSTWALALSGLLGLMCVRKRRAA